jgi:cytochrome c-type biogenesis protein CcmH
LAAAAFVALASTFAFGQADEIAHPDPVVEQRLKDLAEELRCLVCQNQTIADSSAPLALDLRNQIRQQVAAGRTDDQIRDYMVQRYGDFVLYKPPLKATTVLLWIGPFLLLAAGVVVFVRVTRRAAPAAQPAAHGADEARIAAMLEDEGSGPKP